MPAGYGYGEQWKCSLLGMFSTCDRRNGGWILFVHFFHHVDDWYVTIRNEAKGENKDTAVRK